MGWNDDLDDNEISNLPEEAATFIDGIVEVNDEWLEGAGKEDQLVAMRGWFESRYCDPAIETPYIGREGGYIFIHGGPYDPAELLHERFEAKVEAETIDELVHDLHMEVGDQWAPIRHFDPNDYDEVFGIEVSAADEPLVKLKKRMVEIDELLALQGGENPVKLAQRMAFSAAIAALESYLWETMVYWVDADEDTVKNIVTLIPEFKEATIKLGDIFSKYENLKNDIKGHLQNIVWHNWRKVVPLIKAGLGIKPPSFAQFDSAILKRHDIVHRSGHTQTGVEVVVTADEIRTLCEQITTFATAISDAIAERNRDDGTVKPGADDLAVTPDEF
jgi:Txe/YoeB family toxin of Txe-Axe toxin-antitoxin module